MSAASRARYCPDRLVGKLRDKNNKLEKEINELQPGMMLDSSIRSKLFDFQAGVLAAVVEVTGRKPSGLGQAERLMRSALGPKHSRRASSLDGAFKKVRHILELDVQAEISAVRRGLEEYVARLSPSDSAPDPECVPMPAPLIGDMLQGEDMLSDETVSTMPEYPVPEYQSQSTSVRSSVRDGEDLSSIEDPAELKPDDWAEENTDDNTDDYEDEDEDDNIQKDSTPHKVLTVNKEVFGVPPGLIFGGGCGASVRVKIGAFNVPKGFVFGGCALEKKEVIRPAKQKQNDHVEDLAASEGKKSVSIQKTLVQKTTVTPIFPGAVFGGGCFTNSLVPHLEARQDHVKEDIHVELAHYHHATQAQASAIGKGEGKGKGTGKFKGKFKGEYKAKGNGKYQLP